MDADAGDTLIFVNTEGSRATARLIVAVCGMKSSEVPVMTTVVAPVVAVLLAVRVKVLVVGLVEVNEAVTPLGKPEAARLTLPVNPPVGFTVIVPGTLLPCVTNRVLGAADSVKFGGGVTVNSADVLMPSEATVMVEVPTAIPVANPVALMVAIAGLLLANVRVAPAMELPYWSLGVAVNCCVTPTCADADCGVSVIEDKEGGAGVVAGFVEAGVGLPPQPTSKRKIRAMEARDISFDFFSRIAKLVAL